MGVSHAEERDMVAVLSNTALRAFVADGKGPCMVLVGSLEGVVRVVVVEVVALLAVCRHRP